MDPCTQGLFGACFSSTFAKKKQTNVALICGAVGGLVPDLDVFIRSENDPLLSIEYHRHFTHSLFFVPLGGLLTSIILYLTIFKRRNSFRDIYLYSTIGFLTHGFLDACTSYGTSLFWPFSDLRVAWNIISIIDPIFTFLLIGSIILFFFRKSTSVIKLGTFLSICYLCLGIYKHEKVIHYMRDIAERRGHTIEKILLNPTIGNNILWRSIYKNREIYYVDAVYMPSFSKPKFKEGTKVNVIDKNTIFPELEYNSIQRQDIRRFSFFSQDYIYLHPDHSNIIADLRYGTLPYDSKSLWGIEINLADQRAHTNFVNLRNFQKIHYEKFWKMLKGEFPDD